MISVEGDVCGERMEGESFVVLCMHARPCPVHSREVTGVVSYVVPAREVTTVMKTIKVNYCPAHGEHFDATGWCSQCAGGVDPAQAEAAVGCFICDPKPCILGGSEVTAIFVDDPLDRIFPDSLEDSLG